MDKNLGILDSLNKTFESFWRTKDLSEKPEDKNQGSGGDANTDGNAQDLSYWSLLNETRKKGERRRSSSRDNGELRTGGKRMGNQESLNGIVPKEELEQYIPLSDKEKSSGAKRTSLPGEVSVRDKENRAVDADGEIRTVRRTGEKKVTKVGENKTRVVKSGGEKNSTVYSREEYIDSRKESKSEGERKLKSGEEAKAFIKDSLQTGEGDKKEEVSQFSKEKPTVEAENKTDHLEPKAEDGNSKPSDVQNVSDSKIDNNLPNVENVQVKKFLESIGNVSNIDLLAVADKNKTPQEKVVGTVKAAENIKESKADTAIKEIPITPTPESEKLSPNIIDNTSAISENQKPNEKIADGAHANVSVPKNSKATKEERNDISILPTEDVKKEVDVKDVAAPKETSASGETEAKVTGSSKPEAVKELKTGVVKIEALPVLIPETVKSATAVGETNNVKPANLKSEASPVKKETSESEKSTPAATKTENGIPKPLKLENPSKILASISAGLEVRRASLTKNSNAQEPAKQVTEKLVSTVNCGHIMEVNEKSPKKLGSSGNLVADKGELKVSKVEVLLKQEKASTDGKDAKKSEEKEKSANEKATSVTRVEVKDEIKEGIKKVSLVENSAKPEIVKDENQEVKKAEDDKMPKAIEKVTPVVNKDDVKISAEQKNLNDIKDGKVENEKLKLVESSKVKMPEEKKQEVKVVQKDEKLTATKVVMPVAAEDKTETQVNEVKTSGATAKIEDLVVKTDKNASAKESEILSEKKEETETAQKDSTLPINEVVIPVVAVEKTEGLVDDGKMLINGEQSHSAAKIDGNIVIKVPITPVQNSVTENPQRKDEEIQVLDKEKTSKADQAVSMVEKEKPKDSLDSSKEVANNKGKSDKPLDLGSKAAANEEIKKSEETTVESVKKEVLPLPKQDAQTAPAKSIAEVNKLGDLIEKNVAVTVVVENKNPVEVSKTEILGEKVIETTDADLPPVDNGKKIMKNDKLPDPIASKSEGNDKTNLNAAIVSEKQKYPPKETIISEKKNLDASATGNTVAGNVISVPPLPQESSTKNSNPNNLDPKKLPDNADLKNESTGPSVGIKVNSVTSSQIPKPEESLKSKEGNSHDAKKIAESETSLAGSKKTKDVQNTPATALKIVNDEKLQKTTNLQETAGHVNKPTTPSLTGTEIKLTTGKETPTSIAAQQEAKSATLTQPQLVSVGKIEKVETTISKDGSAKPEKVKSNVPNSNKKVEDPEIDELKRLLLDKLKSANSAPITTTGIKLESTREEKTKTYSGSVPVDKPAAFIDPKSSKVVGKTEDKKEISIEPSKNIRENTPHELNIISEEEREKGTQSSLSNRSSVNLDSRAMSPFSDADSGTATPRRRRSVKVRRQSSGNKSSSESSSRRDSRAFSPSNSRRGSRALSPLSSFSTIQDKIQALSRDSSQSDIVKKTPKIHKLDEKILMLGKEPTKSEKSKEPIKITPKIDATLQSKILKFGMPSPAKLPKKTEPMKVEKSYAVIGGFSFKDPDEAKETTPDPAKAKPYRRNKPKAPPPPGQQEKTDAVEEEIESVPTTPTANRHEVKVKKVKGKAPPPPVPSSELSKEAAKVHDDMVNMTNEINQLLQDSKALHKETKALPTSPTAKRRSSKPSTPSSARKLGEGTGKNAASDDNNNKIAVEKKRRGSKAEVLKNAEGANILADNKVDKKTEEEKVEDKKGNLKQSEVVGAEKNVDKESKLPTDGKNSETHILVPDVDSNKKVEEKTFSEVAAVKDNTSKAVQESSILSVNDKNIKQTDEIHASSTKEKISPSLEPKTAGVGAADINAVGATISSVEHKKTAEESKILSAENKTSKIASRKSPKLEPLDKKEIQEPKAKSDKISQEMVKSTEDGNKISSTDKKLDPKSIEKPLPLSDQKITAAGSKEILTNIKNNLKSKTGESATSSQPAPPSSTLKTGNDIKETAKRQKPNSPKPESKIPTLKPSEDTRGPKISPQTNRKDQPPAEDSISLASSSSRDSFETLKSSRSPSPSSYESCNEADKKKPEKEPEPPKPEEKETKPAVEKKVKYSSRGEVIPDDGAVKPLATYKNNLEPVKDGNTITLVPAYRPDGLKPEEPKDGKTITLVPAYRPEKPVDVQKPQEQPKEGNTVTLVPAYRSEEAPEEAKSKTHSLIESIRKQLKNSEMIKKPETEPKSEEDLSLSDSLTLNYGAVKRKPSTDTTPQDNKFEKYERHLKRYEEMFSPERTPFTPEGTPFSDFSDDSFYDHYVTSDYSVDYENSSSRRSSRCSSTPRRVFPQIAKPTLYDEDHLKEDSPVIFDANLSFDLCSKRDRTPVRQLIQPQPAFSEANTVSNALSTKIADFLNRTDHVMEEWKRLGKSDSGDLKSCVELPSYASAGHPKSKSKSATNIMIKGLLNYSRGSSASSVRSPSRSRSRYSESSDRTLSDLDELSEMAVDLTEERATGNLQAERLEAETAERIRLEHELSQIQHEKKNLQQTSERLEMELFYARADVNGLSEGEADLEDGNADAAIYKQKCERVMRELEFTRRRLQQQHEDDLEQLVGLKKQLEKKLSDAYEEVEEQRQVVGQWKRKVQKLQAEMNDLRLLLEEQSSRNNLLEKKQRKFDSEIQMLQDELRSEKNQRDRASREKEIAVAEKYAMEQNLSSVRLELELKEEKLASLSRELDDLTRGGGSEQEVTQLRKAKHDLDMKLKEQEEELDELAGQVSMLEGNKLRLEMSLESLRKEHRREMTQRDDELDEVRSNAHKKVKALESQLESEHEERTLLLREKHELERRLNEAEERGRHYRAADEDALLKLRRDLKKTKALLRDAQVMLERAKQDSPSKAALRALKNQLEDAELARASAVKAKQSLESELNEVSGQLEEALRAKGDAENRYQAAQRESNALRTQVDENEEELAELLKKYRSTVQQLSAEQLANQETAGALAEAEAERASLRDQLAELTAKLEASSLIDPASGLAQKRLEIRIKELESRLELEQTTRGRLEVQIARLKENVERLTEECVQARTKEQAASDLTRKLQRSLRETKEELAQHQAKEQEFAHKKKELEKRLETAEQEAMSARTDLRLAVKRIEDLQNAISGEIGSDSERSESEVDSDSGDDSLISQLPSGLSSARTSRTPDVTPR